jgi:hypothetical protein
MAIYEEIGFFSKFFGTAKGSPAEGFAGDYAEPGIDLVQPGRVGWGEMDMIPGSSGKPGANLFVLMGRIVVHNNMHIQFLRHVRFPVLEKLQKTPDGDAVS